MRPQYGWLKVHGDVNHPQADKHGGHIYVHKQDIINNHLLSAGTPVTFFLYADGKGIGAECCQAEYAYTFAENKWSGNSPWTTDHFDMSFGSVTTAPGAQVSSKPCTTAPPKTSSVEANSTPAELPKPGTGVIEANGKLPSKGSVGHSDGSCKRCAFYPKGRCQNGFDCDHCHFDHTERKRLRTRKERVQTKDVKQLPMGEDPALSEDLCSDCLSFPQDDHKELVAAATLLNEEIADVKDTLVATEVTAKAWGRVDSDDDTIDSATHAPSSSYPSDDEASTSEPCTPQRKPKSLPSEISDSELTQESSTPTLSYTPEQAPPSPTSWSAQQRLRKAGAASFSLNVTPVDITRMARGLLNKLTQERFESLCTQIVALPISTPEQLAALAAEIFEKATTQDCFRCLYTELCMRLDIHFAERSDILGGKTFRKVLVSECQATFERNLQPVDSALFDGLSEEECFEVEMKLKTRRLGNMRFIGELLVHRLLAQKLCTGIIFQLLDGDEAALESLIALLTVIAPCFEQKNSPYQAPMRDAFAMLRRKRADKDLSQRLRCHLSDLFDARARGWTARTA